MYIQIYNIYNIYNIIYKNIKINIYNYLKDIKCIININLYNLYNFLYTISSIQFLIYNFFYTMYNEPLVIMFDINNTNLTPYEYFILESVIGYSLNDHYK